MLLTPEQVSEINETWKMTTPGEWKAIAQRDDRGADAQVLVRAGSSRCVAACPHPTRQDTIDVVFCALAHQDVPNLIETLLSVQRRLAAAEAELAQLRTIFSRDLLEDDAGVRAAYERGLTDGRHSRADALSEWLKSSGQVAIQHALKTFESSTQEGQE
jgi:hypothetical protein